MPIRPPPQPLPELAERHIHRLISGRGWFFYGDPPAFVDDTEALQVYQRLRPLLLPWCKAHLRGAVPWAEGLHTGRRVPPVTAERHGFSMQSCRDFLAAFYGGDTL